MLTWNFFVLIKGEGEGSVSPSILIDNLGELWFPLHRNPDISVGFSGESKSKLSSEEKSESSNDSNSMASFSSFMARI